MAGAETAEALRRLLRRAGHELRNAQNAAAVNLEVVRSRLAAGGVKPESLQSFADNAARGVDEGSRLAEGLVALCGALVGGELSPTHNDGAGDALELSMSPDAAARLVTALGAVAQATGLRVEPGGAGVILRIPPDNETN